MVVHLQPSAPTLMDERGPVCFREVFGASLRSSNRVDSAILNIRLGAVDFTASELRQLERFRVLVAEVNARRVEGEAYAMAMDPAKRRNLIRLLRLFSAGILRIRSAPLGGWAPDFTVFSRGGTPQQVLLGIHWFRRPFPHRGPAWAVRLEAADATRAKARFEEIWHGAHDIGPAIQRLMAKAPTRVGPQPYAE